MLGPRIDIINWDDCFMALAKLFTERSRDPNTQVGACIVDSLNHVIGVGFNGLPRNCDPTAFPWDREGGFLDTKYAYCSHAEANAIDNGDRTRISGARIYTTLFPCNNCAIRIIQNGIKEVIYLSDKYHDSEASEASRRLFAASGVSTRQLVCERKQLTIDLEK